MKAYLRNLLAMLASVFSAQAVVSDHAAAQDPAERQAWSQALNDGTLEAFEQYLANYPISIHSREAFARIIQLSPEPAIFSELDETRSSSLDQQLETLKGPAPGATPVKSSSVLDRRFGLY